MAAVIYLHWTATGYDWIRPGCYHSIIGGHGRVNRLNAYSVDLPAHTYGRNRNSVALPCICMCGIPDPLTQAPHAPSTPLAFKGEHVIPLRGADFAVQIDALALSWVIAADLLSRYESPSDWDASLRRILIEAVDVAPTYRDDSVQASVGWPLVECTLQTFNAPVILTGILRPGPSSDRAWCKVLEFAEEFWNSVSYEPLVLAERWGG